MKRLGDLQSELVIAPDPLSSGGPTGHSGNKHCLCDVLTDDRQMSRIIERIEKLPDFFIDETVDATRDYSVTPTEASALKGFLKARRDGVPGIIASHKSAFPGVKQWSFL